MQYRKGMDVIGVDGEKVGEIDRVVIDPRSGEVTDIVVRSGFLFPTDKVVPVHLVNRTTKDEMKLTVMAEEANNFSDFLETTYIIADEHQLNRYGYTSDETLATPYFWYPYAGTTAGIWGGTAPVSPSPDTYTYPYQQTEDVNIPQGTIPLKQGAKVTGIDGKQVGSLERVITDNEKDRVTHLVIVKGTINREKKLVPANWINNVTEDSVELAVNADFVDTLKSFKES